MKKFSRKIIAAICILLCLSFLFPQVNDNVAAKEKKYLTLVQNLDGKTWVAYEGIATLKNGSIMLDAKAISKNLSLTYKDKGNNKFTITRDGDRVSTYTIGTKKFKHEEGGCEAFRNTPCAPYIKNKKTYFHYTCLGFLTKLKLYDASKAKEYADRGYSGIICVGTYHTITGAPALDSVLNSKGKSFFHVAAAPTPTPTPVPVPSSQNSTPGNYLIAVNGWYLNSAANYKTLKGLVEVSEDGSVMVNANLLAEYLDNGSIGYDKNFAYHNIDQAHFSIICDGISNIYTRNQKDFQYQHHNNFKDTIEYTDETGDYTPAYLSKNNGFDYIDPDTLQILFDYSDYGYKLYNAEHAKAYAEQGYDGVLVFNKYNTVVKLPSIKKIKGSYDFSDMSKFKLDQLPYIIVQGVKIYGTNEFIKPSEIDSSYSSWGYDFDLEELEYFVAGRDSSSTAFDLMDNSIGLSRMGAGTETIDLVKDNEKECYLLYITSRYGGSLTNTDAQYSMEGKSDDYWDDDASWVDEDYQVNRDVLKALLYKISSKPEVLYDAILDSWAGDNEKYKINKNFVTVGDAKIKYDFVKHCYVIKSVK